MTVPRDQLLKSMVSHPLPSVWLRSSMPRSNDLMAIGRVKFSNPRSRLSFALKLSGELPSAIANSGHRPRQPGIPRRWVVQVQRDLVRAVPHAGRVLRQRVIRAPQNPRTLVGSWFAPNVRTARRSASCIRADAPCSALSATALTTWLTARVESRIRRLGTASNLSKLVPSRQSQLHGCLIRPDATGQTISIASP